MLLTAIEHAGPAAIRYPRGSGFGVDITAKPKQIEIGKAEMVRSGSDVAIVAYGTMVGPAVEAAERLSKDGVDAAVVNARFVKPIDAEMMKRLSAECGTIVTVEEAYLAGGFGSAVMETLESEGVLEATKVVRMGVEDEIVSHGDPKVLLGDYGLDADGIYESSARQRSTGRRTRRRQQASASRKIT